MAQVVQMSLAQSAALARLAEASGEGWIFGEQPIDDAMREHHDIAAVCDADLLHVLLSPPSEWVSVDRTGAEVARTQATRAEVMTVQLRASHRWASMRRLLREKGVEPATTVLGDGFDDTEDEDVGVLVTADDSVVAWRRRYDDEKPDTDQLVDWQDITDSWQGSVWEEQIVSALTLRRDGLQRLRPPGAG
jgi:hypothetical protein